MRVMKRRLAAVLAAAAVGLVSGGAGAADSASSQRDIALCLADDNAPFSTASAGGTGFDVEVAEELGRRLGTPARLVWVPIPNRGGLGKALRGSLLAGQCEAFLGVPDGGEVRGDLAEKHLLASEPYSIAAYLLLQAPGRGLRGVDQLRGARRVGVVTATPADLHAFREGLARIPYGANAELLRALAKGEVDAALVWSPALARARQAGFTLWDDASVPGGTPRDGDLATRFVIAVRAASAELAGAINLALRGMRDSGYLAKAAARHGLEPAD